MEHRSEHQSVHRDEPTFAFLQPNEREGKPRKRGLTGLRAAYYTPIGRHYLEDLLETMDRHIDIVKLSAQACALMPRGVVRELVDLCHAHDVLVSTSALIEYALVRGPQAVHRYIEDSKSLGFDIMELSCGLISVPTDDWLRLVEKVQQAGLKAQPEVSIQYDAGDTRAVAGLEAEGTRDPEWVIGQAKRLLEAGAYMILLESEGVTENVARWRTDIPARLANVVGLDNVAFEAAEPKVFAWYVKNFGPEVNLFIDHSQIVQLECLRSGIWGTSSLWGRVVTYKG